MSAATRRGQVTIHDDRRVGHSQVVDRRRPAVWEVRRPHCCLGVVCVATASAEAGHWLSTASPRHRVVFSQPALRWLRGGCHHRRARDDAARPAVVSKTQILEHVWNYDFNGDTGVIESYVSYLRRKLDTGEPRLLHTVRGVGYVLRVPRT
ncbi:MAG: winged helix-turn-helix transcriptional regulator [Pseudonocardiales bacterium]|nr:winged helix-turn-helix transcriptional regulator [Pseudonocardiales bacterium]